MTREVRSKEKEQYYVRLLRQWSQTVLFSIIAAAPPLPLPDCLLSLAGGGLSGVTAAMPSPMVVRYGEERTVVVAGTPVPPVASRTSGDGADFSRWSSSHCMASRNHNGRAEPSGLRARRSRSRCCCPTRPRAPSRGPARPENMPHIVGYQV